LVVGKGYFFLGLAIVAVFMGERAWPGLFAGIVHFDLDTDLLMVMLPARVVCAWFDFRKRIRTPKGDRDEVVILETIEGLGSVDRR
jgi:hypothetical protein